MFLLCPCTFLDFATLFSEFKQKYNVMTSYINKHNCKNSYNKILQEYVNNMYFQNKMKVE